MGNRLEKGKGTMKNIELKRLQKEKTPKQIIYLHIHNVINLTSKQVDKMINLKNGVKKNGR